jgi:DNA (cytosine-5)-methyltransferase 1
MIDHMRPRFFIMENVKGLVSAGAPGKSGGGPATGDGEGDTCAFEAVLGEIAKLGYRTVYGILDAVNYGAPQFRERLIIIGSRDGEDVYLPVPTRFQTHQDPAYRWASLRSAIGDLEDDPGECLCFSTARAKLLDLIPEGGNWKDLPPSVQEKAMGGAYTSGGGKVGFYRRLSYSQPSPTLVTSPVQKASMLCHPTRVRPLSVMEYSRIQEFPRDWGFAGPLGSRYRQIGNAIPVSLGRALGQALVSVADGQATVQTRRTRGTSVFKKLRDAMELAQGVG